MQCQCLDLYNIVRDKFGPEEMDDNHKRESGIVEDFFPEKDSLVMEKSRKGAIESGCFGNLQLWEYNEFQFDALGEGFYGTVYKVWKLFLK